MDEDPLKDEAARLFAVHRDLVAEAGAEAEARVATVTSGYRRLAEAAAAVEQAGRAWDAAREARALMPANPALAAAADQAEEAYFSADAQHRDVVAEVTPAQERAMAGLVADLTAVAAANTAFRAAQDAYFAAMARHPGEQR
ncbi:hypothetical protein [Catenuloplanes atrovinosus]|uniref:Uncharacterized protein n=1 Tax=Catenuloplanes atrovinosus TaxID=137266 RepID=A0AAE3YPB4_9ACTN|nr:hypothetical protein [Catenuloplanes atrovinosus]MDR7276167.1 hypothetical protein [Catenuloplanes atrovinosus]